MKSSLSIAVQALASSWNQTQSNGTGQWSGESFALSHVCYPVRCGRTHEGSKFDVNSDWNIKEQNNAGNRLVPHETFGALSE